MKRLFLVFTIGIMLLTSMLQCFALEQNNSGSFISDLPLVLKYENTSVLNKLSQYEEELQAVIAEQNVNMNMLNTMQYVGYYEGSFDSASLKRCLKLEVSLEETSPLFKSELYKQYYSFRTQKLLRQYQASTVFDYSAFYKSGRSEFDSFIKSVTKSKDKREQLIILLQEKLTDRLVELEPGKRRVPGEEILALRLTSNSSKSLDLVYQFWESRTRLELLTQISEINRKSLESLANSTSITINSSSKGKLLLYRNDAQGKMKANQIYDIQTEADGYRGMTVLWELYEAPDFKLGFIQEGKAGSLIPSKAVIAAVGLNQKGFFELGLDELLIKEPIEQGGDTPPLLSNTAEKSLKNIASIYQSKSSTAQAIVKELNRYRIYMELKNRNTSNYYTRSFEAKKLLWKKDLNAKLNSFGPDGAEDFWMYIKKFALLDRSNEKLDKEKLLIAKYRNSDIQFRTTDEGILWITDILYSLKYMK